MTTAPTTAAGGALARAVLEVEQHAAGSGWDRPAQVFALVDTAELLRREPQLAAVLGVEDAEAAGDAGLTPVEQEADVDSLEELLPRIAWPEEVVGCAVVLEATTVPPDAAAGGDVPEGAEAAAAWAADHPGREEARVVAGVLRTGESWCAIRQRAHDDETMVLSGPDLVPALLELLHATFVPDGDDTTRESHDE